MGSMGSLGLPSMALLKAKPGLFYRNSGLKTKVPFAALKSEYWEASPCFYFPDLSWALFSILPYPHPTGPLCPLYAVGCSACRAATNQST